VLGTQAVAEGRGQRDEGFRAAGVGLGVRGPKLDGAEPGVGSHVPPDLLQAVYRAGTFQVVHVGDVVFPRGQRLWKTGSVHRAGEDQDAAGEHVRVFALPEGRVDREGEEVGDVLPETV